MFHWRPVLLVLVLVMMLSACAPAVRGQPPVATGSPAAALNPGPTAFPQAPPASCPVTKASAPAFTPPPPFSPDGPSPSESWYGNEAFWTAVPKGGAWSGLPKDAQGYTQKVYWWANGYSPAQEPAPQLSVTGRRLDAQSAPPFVSRATNASAADIGEAMMVGMDFPTPGCWEITGHYKDADLSFVVWVAP